MKPQDAKHGMTVTSKRGTGTLIHNVNGWDVKLEDGTVRQSVDLSEWSAEEKQPVHKIRTPFRSREEK